MEIGYYRVKLSDLPIGVHTFDWYVNGEIAGQSKVIIREKCDENHYVKFLDTNGFYRFFTFNNHWQQTDSSSQIGTTNNIITSLKDSLTNRKNNGYKNNRTLTLTAVNVSEEELTAIQDIFTSPRVYLKVGPTDLDWVECTMNGDGITRRMKNNFGKLTINITLPERFSITSI